MDCSLQDDMMRPREPFVCRPRGADRVVPKVPIRVVLQGPRGLPETSVAHATGRQNRTTHANPSIKTSNDDADI